MLFTACTFSILANAQIKVANTGKVCIATADTVTPLSLLSVGSAGHIASGIAINMQSNWVSSYNGWNNIYSQLQAFSDPTWNIAINGETKASVGTSRLIGLNGAAKKIEESSEGRAYGVLGIAGYATSGYNYGICGFLQTNGGNGAAVYGSVNSYAESQIPGRYAGYFDGQTKVNGNFYATTVNTTSDARLKTNVTDVNKEKLHKIQYLRPVQFTWQQIEDIHTADTATVKKMYFGDDVDYERSHYGFIAQDVQKLFPELVQEDGDGYLSVNYIELIPLLIQAVQELSARVEELRDGINNKESKQ